MEADKKRCSPDHRGKQVLAVVAVFEGFLDQEADGNLGHDTLTIYRQLDDVWAEEDITNTHHYLKWVRGENYKFKGF